MGGLGQQPVVTKAQAHLPSIIIWTEFIFIKIGRFEWMFDEASYNGTKKVYTKRNI